MKRLTFIDAGSAYQDIKLNEKSSYLTKISYQFGKYRYVKLRFGKALAGIYSRAKK